MLILDEPTSGLDPNQLVEVRKVIKQASQDKTVIFSTHIMQEVEALCDDVVIINKGRIVANDKVGALKSMKKDVLAYRVEFEQAIDVALFQNAGLQVNEEASNQYLISSVTEDARKMIMKIAGEEELPLVNITKEEQSLEAVFQELTKN